MTTIIILLILAGITISQLNNSGLFDKSKQAKEKYQNAQKLENSVLDDYQNKIDTIVGNRGNVTLTEEEYQKFKRQGYTLLYEGNANQKKEYSFIEGTGDVKDYDFVVITFIQGYGYGMGSFYYNTRDITKDKKSDIILTGYYDRFSYMHFINNGFVVDDIAGDGTVIYPYRIYGINM